MTVLEVELYNFVY